VISWFHVIKSFWSRNLNTNLEFQVIKLIAIAIFPFMAAYTSPMGKRYRDDALALSIFFQVLLEVSFGRRLNDYQPTVERSFHSLQEKVCTEEAEVGNSQKGWGVYLIISSVEELP
jgi:hypothetical protein